MPVAVRHDPFRYRLPAHQVAVLALLMPAVNAAPVDWPLCTRAAMRLALGYSPTNSLNRILNHPKSGLVPLGLVEVVVLDVEGVLETSYRITTEGRLYACRK